MTTLLPGSELDVQVQQAMGYLSRYPQLNYSTSFFGLGQMLAWLQAQGVDGLTLEYELAIDDAPWLCIVDGLPRPGYAARGQTLPHAVALCVVAVGEREEDVPLTAEQT